MSHKEYHAQHGERRDRATRRNAPDRYNQAAFGRPKSKMLLPHRFAIGCEDGLADPEGIGWIVRQDVVWQKMNGLPESVTDRCRDSHEFIFHLTKSERYYSAMDEIREAHADVSIKRAMPHRANVLAHEDRHEVDMTQACHPLGKLPGSVWSMSSEPLLVPEWAKERYRLPDHFASFPSELPRRIILGWSPSGICVECGEGRRPVVERSNDAQGRTTNGPRSVDRRHESPGREVRTVQSATVLGYACACTPYTDHPASVKGITTAQPRSEEGRDPRPAFVGSVWDRPKVGAWREYHLSGWATPPARPAIVLDPFGGTGTTALVARALGRTGVSLDLSADYGRLAKWRIFESGAGKKAEQRTWAERQGGLL